jgi:hypothetical protein
MEKLLRWSHAYHQARNLPQVGAGCSVEEVGSAQDPAPFLGLVLDPKIHP